MTMAKNLVTILRPLPFLRRDSRESLRQWVQELMTQIELMVKPSQRHQISILDPHQVVPNPSPKVVM